MKLIIVESPTKSKTITKFLDKDYKVLSSYGHVRDLPKSKMGVDIEKNFTPQYLIPTKARKVLKELKDALEYAEQVILASDEDREGEAIAWHLIEALGLKKVKNQKLKTKSPTIQRIVFHEITKSAIEHALKTPRELDMNLVNAQQARRILDRLVGYELSPFLWTKIRYGLSAGRVQSVAVRIIVEREREIEAFKPQEYWTVDAELTQKDAEHSQKFKATLQKINDKKLDKFALPTKTDADKILKDLQGAIYTVTDIEKKETKRNPVPPFTTSTLQQDASRKLYMSAKQTMILAQKLYETGLITYMRTDSVNMASSALTQAKEVIVKEYGSEYALSEPRLYSTKSKGAQEAHEAIRPTDFTKTTDTLRSTDTKQKQLYDLIYKRALATQMAQAVFDKTAIDIGTSRITDHGTQNINYKFRANGQVVKFDGFIRVYTEGRDEVEDVAEGDAKNHIADNIVEGQLPELAKGEVLDLKELLSLQHFTEPPLRYSDATLIKALEAHGIGRPSTYAPTLSTIQDRNYVTKNQSNDGKKYKPTEIGILVNDMLVEHFHKIVDIEFTSHIEEELDDIAQGKLTWTAVLKEFYTPFKSNLEQKNKTVKKIEKPSDIKCEHCGQFMIMKFGRNGKFLACPDTESKITRPLPEEEAEIKVLQEKTKNERCPECINPMNVHRGRFGYFLGCVNYPKCKGIAKIVTRIGYKCPDCKAQGRNPIGDIIERKSRGRGKPFFGCLRYPDCNFLTNKKPESNEELEQLYQQWKEKPKRVKQNYPKKS